MIKRKVRMLKKRKKQRRKKKTNGERKREGGRDGEKEGWREGGREHPIKNKHKPTTSIQHIRGNIDGNERTQFPRHSPTCLP